MKQQASESREGRFYCADEFYLTCRTQTFNNKDNFITTIYSISVCVCVCTHCVLKLLKYGESVLGYMSDVLLLSFFRLNVHTSFLVFAFLFRICLNVFRPLKKKKKSKLHFEIRSKSSKKESANNKHKLIYQVCVLLCISSYRIFLSLSYERKLSLSSSVFVFLYHFELFLLRWYEC